MTDWKNWIGIGALAMLCGGLALSNAVAASLALTMIFGMLFTVVGLAKLWAGITGERHEHRALSIVWGLLNLLIGVSLVANPVEGSMSLTLLITGFLLASGVIRLLLSWRMRETGYFWLLLLSGAGTVLLGAYIVAHFEALSLSLLGLILGIDLVIDGIGLIGFGLFLRNRS